MIKRLTAQQKYYLIENAVNAYFHQAASELEKKTLGDIERRQWEIAKERCQQFFADETPVEPDSLQGEVKRLREALEEAETHLTIPFEPEIALHWVREGLKLINNPTGEAVK